MVVLDFRRLDVADGIANMGIVRNYSFQLLNIKKQKKGYVGAMIAGILGGIFSSPCSTPVLIVLLAIVANSDSLAWGILLLLLYSIGHGILAIVCGTWIGFVQRLSQNDKYRKLSKTLQITLGLMMSLIGFYMLYLAF